jgi:hypothetical protein
VAGNEPKGPGRKGSLIRRSQMLNPKTRRWTTCDDKTGRFIDVGDDSGPFKGVRKGRLRYRGGRG